LVQAAGALSMIAGTHCVFSTAKLQRPCNIYILSLSLSLSHELLVRLSQSEMVKTSPLSCSAVLQLVDLLSLLFCDDVPPGQPLQAAMGSADDLATTLPIDRRTL
jgi:hypothetical protein